LQCGPGGTRRGSPGEGGGHISLVARGTATRRLLKCFTATMTYLYPAAPTGGKGIVEVVVLGWRNASSYSGQHSAVAALGARAEGSLRCCSGFAKPPILEASQSRVSLCRGSSVYTPRSRGLDQCCSGLIPYLVWSGQIQRERESNATLFVLTQIPHQSAYSGTEALSLQILAWPEVIACTKCAFKPKSWLKPGAARRR